MDPRWIFPMLAIVFAALAALRFARERRFGPAVRTWVILAVSFAAVSAWVHTMT
jgi:hypothetical protein